ncbi:MAG: 50S ribosomal protein L10 [Omnitrophica WOR_2 bacterium RBG_13_44_8b]|nr:MAG: 50S ribosomal protein L10 [Omnitrophica WOR_2 bacterium RBG_13_44_8b]
MKKIGLLVKEISENRIKDFLKDSSALFIIKYSGISGPDLSSLRQNLKNSHANLFVVKNSVARRALKGVKLDDIIKYIEGPCGLVFAEDEPVGPSKVLYNFGKDHEQLKLEGGYLKDRVIEKKDIESLAKLPTKEVLRAQVVMTLNSPIAGLVFTLNQVLAKIVYCLDQIRQKKTS